MVRVPTSPITICRTRTDGPCRSDGKTRHSRLRPTAVQRRRLAKAVRAGTTIGLLEIKAGRGWHHHSRALQCRSMGQGDNRLPECGAKARRDLAGVLRPSTDAVLLRRLGRKPEGENG